MDNFSDEELAVELRRNRLLLNLADNAGENEALAYLESIRRALEQEAKARGLASCVTDRPVLALSIRQPWAHAIVHLGKDIENRNRTYGYRGPVLIHASAGMTADEYADAIDFIGPAIRKARPTGVGGAGSRVPKHSELERGGIIGIATITDCVDAHHSPWWMGPRGLVLERAQALPFTPCRGTVTPLFWLPPVEVRTQLAHLIAAYAGSQIAP